MNRSLTLFLVVIFSCSEADIDNVKVKEDKDNVNILLVAEKFNVVPGEGVRLRCISYGNRDIVINWDASGGRLFGEGEDVVWLAPDKVGEYNIKCIGRMIGGLAVIERSVVIRVESAKDNYGKIVWEGRFGKRYRSEIIRGLAVNRCGDIFIGGDIPDIYSVFFWKLNNNGEELFSIERLVNECESRFFNFVTDIYDNLYFSYTFEPIINKNSKLYGTIIEGYDSVGRMKWSNIFSLSNGNYINPVYFDTKYEDFFICYTKDVSSENNYTPSLVIDKYNKDGNKIWELNLFELVREIKDMKIYKEGVLLWGYNNNDRLVIVNGDGKIEGYKDIEDELLASEVGVDGRIYTVEKKSRDDIGLYLRIYGNKFDLMAENIINVDSLGVFSECKPYIKMVVNGENVFIGIDVYSGERVCDPYIPPGPPNCSCSYYPVIVKYNVNGEEIWKVEEGQRGSIGIDVILDLWSDGLGNVYTKRYYPKYEMKNPYKWEDKYFLIKYNSKGDKMWSLMFPEGMDYPFVINDFQNNIYVGASINEENDDNYKDIIIIKIE